ncbi:hypothetical protein [Nocardia xishanensis]
MDTGELARIIVSDNWRRYVDQGHIGAAVVNAFKTAGIYQHGAGPKRHDR